MLRGSASARSRLDAGSLLVAGEGRGAVARSGQGVHDHLVRDAELPAVRRLRPPARLSKAAADSRRTSSASRRRPTCVNAAPRYRFARAARAAYFESIRARSGERPPGASDARRARAAAAAAVARDEQNLRELELALREGRPVVQGARTRAARASRRRQSALQASPRSGRVAEMRLEQAALDAGDPLVGRGEIPLKRRRRRVSYLRDASRGTRGPARRRVRRAGVEPGRSVIASCNSKTKEFVELPDVVEAVPRPRPARASRRAPGTSPRHDAATRAPARPPRPRRFPPCGAPRTFRRDSQRVLPRVRRDGRRDTAAGPPRERRPTRSGARAPCAAPSARCCRGPGARPGTLRLLLADRARDLGTRRPGRPVGTAARRGARRARPRASRCRSRS